MIFASTGGANYGEQETFPVPGDHPQYPVSPYGISKLAGERNLHFYHTQYGISYAALRYANVYCPCQDSYGEAGVVAIFSANLVAQKGSTINGSGGRRATMSTSGMSRVQTRSPLKTVRPPARITFEPSLHQLAAAHHSAFAISIE